MDERRTDLPSHLDGLPSDMSFAPLDTYDPRLTKQLIGAVDTTREDQAASAPDTRPPTAKHYAGDSPVGFEYLRVIGRGGFGEVWEAIQKSLGRLVALKRLHHEGARSTDATQTPSTHDRMFRQEAFVTALLEHPTIVPVHEFMVDRGGRAVLAMKRVQGRGWDQMLREDFRALEPIALIERHLPILESITQAVAFAHSRGIVHRDLKPSQVLVGEFGEVYLTDWGLALAYDPSLLGTPESVDGWDFATTREGATSPSGTPSYMAPEQTAPTAGGIGPWTDVYLLGGILYYLITGSHPHPAERSNEAFYQARLGVVMPPAKVAPGREIPEPLAQLAMRALSVLPADRPGSAREFLAALQDVRSGARRRAESDAIADSVRERLNAGAATYEKFSQCQTHLLRAGELWPDNPRVEELNQAVRLAYAQLALEQGDLRLAQVQAFAMPNGEARTRLTRAVDSKWDEIHRREKVRKRSLVAVGTLSLAFIITVAVMNASLRTALETAEAQRTAAATARVAAEQNAHRAKSAVDSSEQLVAFIIQDLREKLAALDRVDLLDSAADETFDHYKRQADESLGEAEHALAAQGFEHVRTLYEEQGNLAGALKAAEESVALARRKFSASPADEATIRSLVTMLTARSYIQFERGEFEQSRASAEEAVRVIGEPPSSGNESPKSVVVRARATLALARCQLREGEMDVAEAQTRARLAEVEGANAGEEAVLISHSIAELANQIGDIAVVRGNLDEAQINFGKLRDARRKIVEMDGSNAADIRELGVAESKVGDVMLRQGDPFTALEQFERARDIHAELVERYPMSSKHLRFLGVSLSRIGAALNSLRGREDELIAVLYEWKGIVDRLLARDPGNATWQRDQAVVLHNLARACRMSDRLDEALMHEEASILARRRMAEERPAVESEWEISTALSELATIHREMGNLDLARQSGEEALVLVRRAAERSPGDMRLRVSVAFRTQGLGEIALAAKDNDTARSLFNESLAMQNLIIAEKPDLPAPHDDALRLRLKLAETELAAGLWDAALAIALPAIEEITTRSAKDAPFRARNTRTLAQMHEHAACACGQLGRVEEAYAHLRAAVAEGSALPASPQEDSLLGKLRLIDPDRYDEAITPSPTPPPVP